MEQEQNLEQTLTEATRGLLYQSESDYPFEYVELGVKDSPPLTEELVREHAGHPADAPVKKQSFEAFFGPLTQAKDWYGDEEMEMVKQYVALKEKLEKMLSGIQVFRIGATEVDVYIIGKSAAGHWAGLQTKAVET